MPARRDWVLALVAIMLIGWVISVAIRSARGEHPDVVIEAGGIAFASGILWTKLGGGKDDEGGPS